jgi:pSer/pThr/pTyr-binding forkhead associated (FHA) protein
MNPEEEAVSSEEAGLASAPDELAGGQAGPRLVLLRDGEETDTAFPLPQKGTVGRFDPATGPIDVDLAGIADAAYVSRRHAEVERTDEGWVLRDLGSSNGVYVHRGDWERVEEALLEDGLQVALGNAKFVFRAE